MPGVWVAPSVVTAMHRDTVNFPRKTVCMVLFEKHMVGIYVDFFDTAPVVHQVNHELFTEPRTLLQDHNLGAVL